MSMLLYNMPAHDMQIDARSGLKCYVSTGGRQLNIVSILNCNHYTLEPAQNGVIPNYNYSRLAPLQTGNVTKSGTPSTPHPHMHLREIYTLYPTRHNLLKYNLYDTIPLAKTKEYKMANWKSVEGYEGRYEVSDDGNVKSLDYNHTGREGILKPRLNKHGYYRVNLHNGNSQKGHRVHRLVLSAFVPNPENKPFVNHIDECKTNNNISNLEWSTPLENTRHGSGIERMGKTKYKRVKMIIPEWGTEVEYDYLGSVKKDGYNPSLVSRCCRGLNKKHKGMIWEWA